jgi:hypothetical protein
MDIHEATVMVFVFAGLFFIVGGSGDSPGAAFLLGIVS